VSSFGNTREICRHLAIMADTVTFTLDKLQRVSAFHWLDVSVVIWITAGISFLITLFLVTSLYLWFSRRPRLEEHCDYDVIIVGHGVVGASVATLLGRQGKKVLVLDKCLSEPDRIVGELMQPRGVKSLRDLGLIEAVEGIDPHVVKGYAVYYRGENFHCTYPAKNQLPGMGFHNGRFVMGLRRLAWKTPGVTVVQASVDKVLRRKDGSVSGVSYSIVDGDKVLSKSATAPLTVLASGCLSSLRNLFISKPRKEARSSFLGLIMKDCDLPYPNTANVFLADPTPVLCYPISSNELRVLVDFPSGKIPRSDNGDLTRHLLEKTLPNFPKSMQPSFRRAVEDGKFMSMPNQSMESKPLFCPGICLIGDSLNMRHPLTGGGMTVGLKDVQIFTELMSSVTDLKDSVKLDSAIRQFYASRKAPNAVINVLADALYRVFCAEQEDMRAGCYSYLARGGHFVHGPISFLSGISESQGFLLLHFFAVAIYSVFQLNFPIPTPGRIARAYMVLRNAVHIIYPLVMTGATSWSLIGVVSILRLLFPL